MGRYLLRRLAFALVLVFVVSSVALLLTRIVPGTFEDFECLDLSVEACQALKAKRGLNEPIWTQYLTWVSHALRFDFGQSLLYSRPVSELIRERALNTSVLAIVALFFA